MKLNTFCKRAACLLLAVICALSLTLPALAAGDKNISNAAKGVARVLVMDPVTNQIYSTGTAFGIGKAGEAPQYFVTNKHVVDCEYTIAEGITVNLSAIKVYIMKTSLAVVYNKLSGTYEVESSQLIPCEILYEEIGSYPDLAILRAAEPFEGHITLPLAKASAKRMLPQRCMRWASPARRTLPRRTHGRRTFLPIPRTSPSRAALFPDTAR